jgi:hypothetical protein
MRATFIHRCSRRSPDAHDCDHADLCDQLTILPPRGLDNHEPGDTQRSFRHRPTTTEVFLAPDDPPPLVGSSSFVLGYTASGSALRASPTGPVPPDDATGSYQEASSNQ